MVGENLPSPVEIESTDLQNIGGASGPPGPPGSGTTVVGLSKTLKSFKISKQNVWIIISKV